MRERWPSAHSCRGWFSRLSQDALHLRGSACKKFSQARASLICPNPYTKNVLPGCPFLGAVGHANENAVVQCKRNRRYVKISIEFFLELCQIEFGINVLSVVSIANIELMSDARILI